MSNPSINRWGLNTFWWNFWFNDFSYSSSYKHDQVFIKLTELYLFYGVNLSYNIFANPYWYASNFQHLSIPAYRRWIVRKPNQFGEVMRYSLRNEADCLFPMKIWILRYGNWLIINQYWFHPLKKKKVLNARLNPNHLDSIHILSHSDSKILIKFKSLMLKALLAKQFKALYYKF